MWIAPLFARTDDANSRMSATMEIATAHPQEPHVIKDDNGDGAFSSFYICSVCLVLLGLVLFVRSKRRQGKDVRSGSRVQAPDESAKEPAVSIAVVSVKTTDHRQPHSVRLMSAMGSVHDSEIKPYLQEIITQVDLIGPHFSAETPSGFVEELVDRIDDLNILLRTYQPETSPGLADFRQILIAVLCDCGVELVHSETWDPSVQRAVTKEVTPGIGSPTIVKFGSTGIRRHGKIVRKQEVTLSIPVG